MKAEIYEGQIYLIPEKAMEIETLNAMTPDNIVLVQKRGDAPAEVADKPAAKQEEKPAENKAPVEKQEEKTAEKPETPKSDKPDRKALLAECKELGIDVPTGTRTTTLPKLIAEAKAASQADEPEEVAEKQDAPAENAIEFGEVFEAAKKFIAIHGEEPFKELLASYEAAKLSDIEEYDFPQFLLDMANKGNELEG